MTDDRLWKQLLYCKRHVTSPDLHSFVVSIKNGIAFVEIRPYDEVFIETKTQKDGKDEITEQWCGTLIAAANRLELLGSDPDTISM